MNETFHTKNKRIRITIHRPPKTKLEQRQLVELNDLKTWESMDTCAMCSHLKQLTDDLGKRSKHGVTTRVEQQVSDYGVERFQLIGERRISSANGRILEGVEDSVFATVEIDEGVLGVKLNYYR